MRNITDLKGERRQVTALYYDIVGSTRQLLDTDPEEFLERLQALHKAVKDVIETCYGHVPARAGDGGLGYFGYPIAHEDATHLAVSAALKIVERSRSSPGRQENDDAFQLRVGVATSLVVVGRSDGMDPDFVGIAPNLAARLQEMAEPNSVAVSEETYRLTRRAFRYQSLGERELKGFPDPQPVWRALAQRQRMERFQAFRRPALPLVGRDEELRKVTRIWAEASAGQGQALLVVGDAGVGKSRLLAELRRTVRDESADIRVFQCSPEDRATPLQPLRRLLEDAIPSASHRPLVAAGADQGSSAGSQSAQEFLRFLIGEASSMAEPLERLPPEEIRRLAKTEIEQLVQSWARSRPQLLFFEDLHWCDSFSLEIIDYLISRLRHSRIMLAGTSRTDVPSSLDIRSDVIRLELEGLNESSTTDLVQVLWRAQPIPEKLPALIFDKTDGMPLFVEELSSLLLDRRIRSSGNNGYDVNTALSEFNVTSSKDLIGARLADLGKARAVIQTASVLGRRCARELIIQLSDMPERKIDKALEAICRSGLMIDQDHAGSGVLVFKHALVQDVAYESLLKSRRRQLHGRVLNILKSDGQASEAVLANHAEGAGRIELAVDYLIEAGRHASRRSALQEARQLLEHAMALIRHDDVRSKGTVLELQIMQVLGPVLIMLEGPGSKAAHSLYHDGATLCEALNRRDRARWFSIYWGWWFTASDIGLQTQRSATILNRFQRSRNREARLQALHCGWATSFNAGQHKTCLSLIKRGLERYVPEDALDHSSRYGGHDAKVCGLGEQGLSQWFVGTVETARDSVHASMKWADELGHLGSRCHALDIAVMLNRYRRDTLGVRRLSQQMAALAAKEELKALEAKAHIFGGWAQAIDGTADGGHQRLMLGLTILEELGTEEDFPVYREMQAEVEGQLGRPETGMSTLEHTIVRAESAGHVFWVAELYRRLALLQKQADLPQSKVLDTLRQAAGIARSQSAATILLRILVDQAECDRDMMQVKDWMTDLRKSLRVIEPNHEIAIAQMRLRALGFDIEKRR